MQIVDEKSMCTFPVSDFVKTLYRIAVNDKTKKILYAKPGLTQAVKKFFNIGI